MVVDSINIMKTTFEINFDLYQAFKQNGCTKTWKQKEAVNQKSFSLFTCKLVIQKKLVNNYKLKLKSSLHYIDKIAYHRWMSQKWDDIKALLSARMYTSIPHIFRNQALAPCSPDDTWSLLHTAQTLWESGSRQNTCSLAFHYPE